MNKKGLDVLTSVLEAFGSSILDSVIVSNDSGLMNDYCNETIDVLERHQISFYFRNENIPEFAGYSFAIGWKWLIKADNLIVLHDSLLPRYRGFSPLPNMLINGENYIGATALFASDKYDEGDIIVQKKVQVSYPIRIGDAILKISALYTEIIVEIITMLSNKITLPRHPQDDSQASYSPWRDQQDYFIDWSLSSEVILRTVNALGFPYEGAKCLVNGKEAILYEVVEIPDKSIVDRNSHIGKVIFRSDNLPVVICGKGLLQIVELSYSGQNKNCALNLSLRSRFS